MLPEGLPPALVPLLSPEAYPHPVHDVELVETHISWVLLTGELAYKIKRPVLLPFVDLRDPERRAYFCAVCQVQLTLPSSAIKKNSA